MAFQFIQGIVSFGFEPLRFGRLVIQLLLQRRQRVGCVLAVISSLAEVRSVKDAPACSTNRKRRIVRSDWRESPNSGAETPA